MKYQIFKDGSENLLL